MSNSAAPKPGHLERPEVTTEMSRHPRGSLGSHIAFVPFSVIMTMFQGHLHLAIKHMLEENTKHHSWGMSCLSHLDQNEMTDCRGERRVSHFLNRLNF